MKFWIATLLLLGFAATGCQKLKDPEFRRLEGFGLRNLNAFEATIGFRVTYFNPNNFSVTVKETATDIFLDSIYVGRFLQDSSINVGRQAEFSIPLSGRVPLQKALSLDLQKLATKDVYLRAKGTVKVGKAGIYVTKPIEYAGIHRLDEVRIQ